MTCSNCGSAPLSRAYTISFSPDERGATELDLHLCTDCLAELCTEPGVDVVEDGRCLFVE